MSDKTPSELSRDYYQFIYAFTQSDFEEEKILGQFYTDFDVASSMEDEIVSNATIDPFADSISIIDPFCGDGRLILGLLSKLLEKNKLNRKKLHISLWDIDASAVTIASIVGDINEQETFDAIVQAAVNAKKEDPELPLFVLGGPPCQGFSTANTRRGAEDMRNWLFKSYARIVRAIQPEGFVFENVKGMLNLDKGRFFEMVKSELKECVEELKVNQVSASSYGVPQRRDRVIIIGGKVELVQHFYLTEISYVQKDGQISLLPPVIGVEDAIGDLPALSPGEDGSEYHYRFPAANKYQRFMRGQIKADEYLNMYRR